MSALDRTTAVLELQALARLIRRPPLQSVEIGADLIASIATAIDLVTETPPHGPSREALIDFVENIARMVGNELDAHASVELRDAARNLLGEQATGNLGAIAEAARTMIAAWEASVDTVDEAALEREAAAIYALDLALAGSEDGWYPIATWEGLPTGQANPVLLCVSDGGNHQPVVGEAWYDPDAYGGSWWWANLDQGDYQASPIVEMQHGVPTFWKPMPTPPRAAWKVSAVDQGSAGA